MSDIIDNRKVKLGEAIGRILPNAERAKFAVGYFFLSGLEAIQKHLAGVSELRLLIGNTTNRQTLEQISEGYKRLDLAQQAMDDITRFSKRSEKKHRVSETAENLREAVELMDQTDEGEKLVNILIRLIEEKRLKVKVYTKGRLHAKAYIFDYKQDGRYEKGIAVVGSSNLTLSGVSHNTELNVVVQGNDNHRELTKWFEELWDEAEDFETHLMDELKQSWAVIPATPYDIYMKTLYALVKDRLEEKDGAEILWDDEITRDLADFQKVAVRQSIQMIRDNGGCFVSDVVGLGKSYIGSAILKHFERTEHARPLIICPKALEDMWEGYNEVYHLNARILSMSLLKARDEQNINMLLEDVKYRDRDVILVDESHNFRHHTIQRYQILQTFLSTGRKCCFLTATPRNKTAWDIYHQIKLFHPDDKTDLPIEPPDLKQYFKAIEKGDRKLPDILARILIRRTRRHILRWYGYAEDTSQPLRELSDVACQPYLDSTKRAYVMVGAKHQYFPKRELETLRYSIEKTYSGLYQQIRRYLGRPRGEKYKPKPGVELTYARYGLWHYVKEDKKRKKPYSELHRAGINLRGLIRVLLFKRFESSVAAFRETLKRLVRIHSTFLKSLEQGIIPAGDDAQQLLYESDKIGEVDLLEQLRELSAAYEAKDFHVDELKKHIRADKELLETMLSLVEPITPEKDDKFQSLISAMKDEPLRKGKCLIFTQYADTAKYLYENLNPRDNRPDIDVIYGTDKTIGEDSAILDKSEQLNEEAMYAIYEKKGGQLSLFEEDEKDFIDLNEAEEMLRQLRRERPEEFDRIAHLRDGIRSARVSDTKGHYVFCQSGRFQKLYLVDAKGEIISRDIPRVLGTIRCSPFEATQNLPKSYNRKVMKVKQLFEEEVKHRKAEREHTLSLSQAQRYVLRELRILFQRVETEDAKAQINMLDKAFRITPTVAVNRELNYLRRNGIVGESLLKNLTRIYHQHSLKERLDQKTATTDSEIIPKIICSEGLT